MTLEQVKDAIQRYYSDTSRSRSQTRDGLEELASDIEVLLDSLDDDDDELEP